MFEQGYVCGDGRQRIATSFFFLPLALSTCSPNTSHREYIGNKALELQQLNIAVTMKPSSPVTKRQR